MSTSPGAKLLRFTQHVWHMVRVISRDASGRTVVYEMNHVWCSSTLAHVACMSLLTRNLFDKLIGLTIIPMCCKNHGLSTHTTAFPDTPCMKDFAMLGNIP